MKKCISACAVLALILVAASCSAKKEVAPSPRAATNENTAIQPIIDASKSKDIDAQLAKYDDIVVRYLADAKDNNADAVKADEAKLATVSEELSKLATDFNPDQLAKYNEITAKLNN
jgi:hypothetical protein